MAAASRSASAIRANSLKVRFGREHCAYAFMHHAHFCRPRSHHPNEIHEVPTRSQSRKNTTEGPPIGGARRNATGVKMNIYTSFNDIPSLVCVNPKYLNNWSTTSHTFPLIHILMARILLLSQLNSIAYQQAVFSSCFFWPQTSS